MKQRAFLMVTVVHLATLASCQSDERSRGWNADLDAYIAAVKQDHYVYRSQTLPSRFEALVTDLRKKIPSYSDQRMLFEFERLAAQLGDGHTYILPWAAERVESKVIPLRFYQFDDGLFVIDANDVNAAWIGARVDRFGSLTSSEAMKKVAEYVSRDSEMGINWIGPLFLRFQGMMEVLNVTTNDQLTMELTLPNGQVKKQAFEFVPVERMRGVPKLIPSKISHQNPPLYLKNVQQTYWIKSLGQHSLYIQFNQVMNDPAESLSGFAARLGDSLRTLKPTQLIIDVRHNNGGDATLLTPLLEELKSYRSRQPSARLVIITGRNTFSACQIFISLADVQVHPEFAGEPSSSKPNFVGEEHEVVLPYSGARGSISNRYHESIPGDKRKSIEIRIPVPLLSSLYFANRDPVLEKLGFQN